MLPVKIAGLFNLLMSVYAAYLGHGIFNKTINLTSSRQVELIPDFGALIIAFFSPVVVYLLVSFALISLITGLAALSDLTSVFRLFSLGLTVVTGLMLLISIKISLKVFMQNLFLLLFYAVPLIADIRGTKMPQDL